MFCSKCGAEIDESKSSKFCSVCGNEIIVNSHLEHEIPHDNIEMIGRNAKSTIEYAVGKNAAYYVDKFQRIENRNGGGAAWVGLIFPLWAVYRKMYIEAVVYFVVSILLRYGITYLFVNSLFDITKLILAVLLLLLDLIGQIVVIANTNKIYYSKVCREIAAYGLQGQECSEETGMKLHYRMRVSSGSVFIYLLLTFAISIFAWGNFSTYLFTNNNFSSIWESVIAGSGEQQEDVSQSSSGSNENNNSQGSDTGENSQPTPTTVPQTATPQTNNLSDLQDDYTDFGLFKMRLHRNYEIDTANDTSNSTVTRIHLKNKEIDDLSTWCSVVHSCQCSTLADAVSYFENSFSKQGLNLIEGNYATVNGRQFYVLDMDKRTQTGKIEYTRVYFYHSDCLYAWYIESTNTSDWQTGISCFQDMLNTFIPLA